MYTIERIERSGRVWLSESGRPAQCYDPLAGYLGYDNPQVGDVVNILGRMGIFVRLTLVQRGPPRG